MKAKKRLIILLSCVTVLLCILTIQNTYAKYLTVATSTTDLSIARWKILVNDQDIRNNSNISQVITPVFYPNSHINSNIIAPNSEGYFEVLIDYADADVSFEYEISITPNPNSSVQDLIATGYSINDSTTVIDLERDDVISDVVLNTENDGSLKLKVYIKWDDSENETMDNEADTAATFTGQTAKLDVNLSFKQIYISE